MSYVNYATAAQLNRSGQMAAKKRARKRTAKKQTSDVVSSISHRGLANWRASVRHMREKLGCSADYIARLRRRMVPHLGISYGEVLTALGSAGGQDETKGRRG